MPPAVDPPHRRGAARLALARPARRATRRGARAAAARALAFALALAGASATAPAAPAGALHPFPATSRAAHERLAAADAIAVATVDRVEDGRIALRDARALHGPVPREFLVKRSPSRPPPLAPGDRALLLLRGARPPYVLVDRPEETIRLADAGAEARWTDAVAGWLRARERPAAWPPLYARWIDTGPEALRDLAVRSLAEPRAPFQPLAAAFAAGLADAAFDPGRALGARRAAALAARLAPAGALRLAERFAAAGASDAELARTAVLAAAPLAAPARDPALLRGLAHADAEVRRAALESLELGPAPAAAVRERVARLARDDPEPWLRDEAVRALAAVGAAP